jgi:hypothetical protein
LVERVENVKVDEKTRESLFKTYLADVYLNDQFSKENKDDKKKPLPPAEPIAKLDEYIQHQQSEIRRLFEKSRP